MKLTAFVHAAARELWLLPKRCDFTLVNGELAVFFEGEKRTDVFFLDELFLKRSDL